MAKASDAERAKFRAEYPEIAEIVDSVRSSGGGIKGLTIYEVGEDDLPTGEVVWGAMPVLDPPNWVEIDLTPAIGELIDRQNNPFKYNGKGKKT